VVCVADEDAVVSRDFASSNLLSAFLFSSSLGPARWAVPRAHIRGVMWLVSPLGVTVFKLGTICVTLLPSKWEEKSTIAHCAISSLLVFLSFPHLSQG